MMIVKNIVYLSYGNDSEYRRAIFSILSFVAWCGDLVNSVRIIVYTDSPDFFRSHLITETIEYSLLSPQSLAEMSGKDNFNHRIKVSVINLTFEKYPEEDLLFFDSDTFFLSKSDILLKKWKTTESFMHVREYQIKNATDIFSAFSQEHYPTSLIKYIAENKFPVGGEIMHFTPEDYSWNAGVLGLNSKIRLYMVDVLNLTDKLYANTKWFVSEQLAFSFVLQRLTDMRPANDVICHYWGKHQKILMDSLLLIYFNAGSGNNMDSELIRLKTNCWRKMIENDLILEQIEIAKASRSWCYFGKKIIRFVLFNGFQLSSYKKLLEALRSSKSFS